jgi:hypothetical protein
MKIEPNLVQDFPDNSGSKPLGPSRAFSSNGADMSVQTSFACYIQKANQLSDGDAGAVERAKKLLFSGELESPDHIRDAAENIATFGI